MLRSSYVLAQLDCQVTATQFEEFESRSFETTTAQTAADEKMGLQVVFNLPSYWIEQLESNLGLHRQRFDPQHVCCVEMNDYFV